MSTGAVMETCALCLINLDGLKSVVQCTVCTSYFHGRCAKVDLRGFHMRRSVWKCRGCLEASLLDPDDAKLVGCKKALVGRESNCQYSLEDMMSMIYSLTQVVKETNSNVCKLIAENKKLRGEINLLKGSCSSKEVCISKRCEMQRRLTFIKKSRLVRR